MERLVGCLLASALTSGANAQLAGTYLVGPGGDLENLTVALDSAYTLGLADGTTFIVELGGEPVQPMVLGPIPGAAADRPLVIRSAVPDPNVVGIGPVHLDHVRHLTLEGFTILSPADPVSSVLRLSSCTDIVLRRCVVRELGTADYGYFDALVEFEQSTQAPSGPIVFDGCTLRSNDVVLRSTGPLGLLTITDCTVEGGFVTMGGTWRYTDCSIRSEEIEETGFVRYLRCAFTSPTGHLRLKGELVQECAFDCDVKLATSEARGNAFRNLEMSYGETLLVGNEADTVTLSFTHQSNVIGNRFRGPVSASADHMEFYNNVFLKGLRITHGPGQIVRYNSFGPGSLLRTDYIGGVVEFNSLWDVYIVQPSITSLDRNNYAGLTNAGSYCATYDDRATFHDPEYDTTAGRWYATNPLLSGRSWGYGNYGAHDIDSVPRSLPGAASANVICITPATFPDTLSLTCGDRIAFTLCTTEDGLHVEPLPPNGLIDMTNLPWGEAMYVFLVDTMGSHLDSCWVERVPYPDQDTIELYAYCGFPVEVNAPTPWFADSMRWSPPELFTDPTASFQVVQSDSSVVLTSTVYSESCGTVEQRFRLNISPAPYAFFTSDQQGATVQLEAHAACCDSILWDLGDSSSYTTAEVDHTYGQNNSYIVTLTCWLAGDSGVTYTVFSVTGIGIEEAGPVVYRVYPNPASTRVRITDTAENGEPVSLLLVDVHGRVVQRARGALPMDQDVSGLANGLYTIVVELAGTPARVPLLIHRE